MIAAVVTDKNERHKLPPTVALIVEEIVAMGEEIEAVYAGVFQADIGPAEVHARFTKVRPRLKRPAGVR